VLTSLEHFANAIDADLDDVQAWWESRFMLSGDRSHMVRAASSRANELFCLRSFYKFATKFDLRPDDPTRRLDAPAIENHVPRMIGRTDFDRLLGELTADAPDLRRAYALGGYAGLRISEAASLDWANLDIEARRIFVRGKGRKERPVPLSPVLLDYLLPNTGGNVVTAGGEPYSAATLQRKINRHMARHGITHTFHDFRKRGASIALSKGANPVAVRAMFGWSSMETVSHYAVVGDDELDRIAEMLT
jgi:site-specific recombinase XerD